MQDHLGRALQFPIDGKFEPIKGLSLVQQDIELLLLTKPGERVMRPAYGCGITFRIWENIDAVATKGQSDIAEAIKKFEPRIRLVDVQPALDRVNGIVFFSVLYIVKETNSAENLVFPFRVNPNNSTL